MRLQVTYTDHLVGLVGEAAAAAAQLEAADAAALADLSARATAERARLSLRLDASPLTDETATAVDQSRYALPGVAPPPRSGAGGWASALHLDGMATQDVAALEYANLKDAHAAEASLAEMFFEEPLATLGRLHGLICRGLVEPDVVGRPRRTVQAIHDGAQGWVIYNPPDPETVPGLLHGLQDWLRGSGARGQHGSWSLPAVVVAGVVHERLLEWQPFEAANGRLARAAAALVLRARDVDPFGVAVAERSFAADAAGYFSEVAATMRRNGDMTIWLERHGEAVVDGLRDAVAEVLHARSSPTLSERARHLVEQLAPGETVTLPEYAARAGVTRETALRDLRRLGAAGLLARDPRTRGLRYRRR